jgi:excisionase family DNA binding protein
MTVADQTGTLRPLAYHVNEAAQVTGLSERTLWREIAAGRLPVVRYGRRATVIRADTLDNWLRSQES